ncbi:hypothetical protein GM418_08085 [Maribellus comscasis]|uniref:Lipoprotein n=1 Tax=Maribellus comscasis TaxID=2681766 RepID=A0A6I6JMJ9_9BACT|nr:hypothetical protein [Maribellus comscasis]QGY43621.1 hypothetical protein GM418_08085 [Maribellus comscasis]
MKKIFLFFLLPLFISCIDEGVDFRNTGDNNIRIYIVKDGEVDNSQPNEDLESLELESTPWLKSSEIEFYDWSSHIFYLNTKKEKGQYSGNYFVIKDGDTPLLLGVFFAVYWSFMPQFPSIVAHDDFFYPQDVIGLGGINFSSAVDTSANFQNFREALESSGILHEGIDVELTKLKKKNATTLEYSIRITNNDIESIYVLDPSKMGEGRFHYYTNGVSFRKDNVSYYSQSESISSPEIRSNWYYKLVPGKSITRTISRGGFSDLPSGNVHFYFSFPGANVDAGEWKKADGRIWLGNKYIEGDISLN